VARLYLHPTNLRSAHTSLASASSPNSLNLASANPCYFNIESCGRVSVIYLTADLRAEARSLEAELFGPRAAQAGPTSRRANHREDARRRQKREREAQQWRAQLRDRAPPPTRSA